MLIISRVLFFYIYSYLLYRDNSIQKKEKRKEKKTPTYLKDKKALEKVSRIVKYMATYGQNNMCKEGHEEG